jgi:Beta-propeller repeat
VTAIAVDASGNAFAAGSTASSNFPTTMGAYATAFAGVQDGFVVKLNPAGSALIYATYLGGFSTDHVSGLALDAFGNCYVTGATQSLDFPVTPGAFSTSKSSPSYVNSVFVTKLNATGTALVYSSFLSGNGIDYSSAIAVDSGGFAYVAGTTQSDVSPYRLEIRLN